jgi:hypothetical protein
MESSLLQWLTGIGWTAFTWALGGLLLLNGLAISLLIVKRDQTLVQRYTSLWLAANLLLVAIGVGVPTVTAVARLAVMGARAVTPDVNWLPGQTPQARVMLAD